MAIVTIQHRRGEYADHDPSKVLPGELVVTQTGDPNTTDGEAAYIATRAGSVKRIPFADEVHDYDERARSAAADATQALADAQATKEEVQQLKRDTAALKSAAETAKEDAETAAASAASTLSQAEETITEAKTTALGEITAAADSAKTEVDQGKKAIADTKASALEEIRAAVDSASETISKGEKDISDTKAAALEEIQTAVQTSTDAAETAIGEIKDQAIAEINERADEIKAVTTSAEQIASEALSTANNAENHMATLDSQMKEVRAALDDVSIDPDDLGLYYDEDTKYLYPTYKDVVSENGIPAEFGGGGGGGGGDVIAAKLTVESTTGWNAKTIAKGGNVVLSFRWSSIEDDMPTGDGAVRITVNDVVKTTYQIAQGNVSVDISKYLSTGSNKVKVRISDIYDQGQTKTFNITAVELSITSSFDASMAYSGPISFPYTPVGAVEKTIHFVLDGTEIGTQVTSVSGRQMTYVIPAQTHGPHKIRVYFDAVIGEEKVKSNELYYEFIYVEPLNNTVIITSSFNETEQPQYSSIPIPFVVYDPKSLTADITISANGTVVSTQTVDRTEHSYTYRANQTGDLSIVIACGDVSKEINITITESEIDVKPETENLALFLSSEGRSNREEHPDTWTYGEGADKIECSFSGFNWASDGWQTDADGITVMRVSGDARITIPYKLFGKDFRTTGKTIELEFATRNVENYDATILSCMSGGRGLALTPQRATLKSEQSEIGAQYKEDEHIRVTFVAEKRAENRLLMMYIDSIPSGVIQYPVDDDFSQTTPVDISIGSNECTIDLYTIRVYDNNLTRHQVLDNWIADTQDATLMLERYTRNNVFDAYGKIEIASLPADLPYFILNAPELPQYKGDKKIITGQYVNRLLPSKSFTFEGCQINVQGTSSAPYYRKNYDMQFKEGFEQASGHADNYELQPGVIPFNRFVLKADVASSEGANNVELVRLYNDICPYKTPEMEEDPRVRWGIDGFPIVVFWNNTDTGEVSFLGKYNFNLPKRAPAPYGYAKDKTLESWEFQNNTSDLMVFKSDYFDETMYTDPDTGETKEIWRYDYEARFPDDTWTDYSKLQEFQSFVYSTYRANATGDALPEAVTYDGVTYTSDTADYRLAKFRAEFPTYAELSTFLFYYAFTELLLMVDSRAKNLFIGFNGSPVTVEGRVATRKATAQPYDMDTGLGTNNEGSLVFGYSLEDTDHLSGGVNIFNGQDSVLWCNVRDAFPTEIRQMFQTLRSGGLLSYTSLEERYETHQSKWPEAVWIEDQWFKYIIPLIAPDPGKKATDVYLSMLQGSKEQQRKWWLSNRFKYMDSKWNAGDALSQVIQLRGYAKADITVTPYTDIYPTVKYASRVVQKRGAHGQPTTLPCPLSEVNDTEIYVYSAPQIESVGDLSGLKVGFADFSQAIRLQSVKIGDADPGYDNRNLYGLSLGNNVLLKTLDVRNCTGLGDTSLEGHTQTTVDLSGCEIIEEVYFDNTKVQGVTFPNGGVLRVIHLPGTITNLTIRNQKAITDLTVASYDNITTLRLENVPTVDTKAILNKMAATTRVRLIGFQWEAADAAEIEALLDKLDTMRGLDESGNNMETAQVSGEIHTAFLTGAEIAAFNQRYPYIRVTADHTSAVLRYYNGATLVHEETVLDGANGVWTGTASKTQDTQHTYTFAGWSKDDDNTVDSDALTNVVADRNVYACFTGTLRKYTVTFVKASDDGGGTLQTINDVAYGTVITAASSYTGATPTTTQGSAEDYPFEGWEPKSATVTGNTTFTAKFGSPIEVKEITDSWDTIIANIDNGTYSTKYKIGNYKPLDLGTEGVINMQIVTMDAEELASGGTAPLAFLGMELFANYMNMSNNNWQNSNVRSYLTNTVWQLIPPSIQSRIQTVKKITYNGVSEAGITNEKLWIPSRQEIFGDSIAEQNSVVYSAIYKSAANRIKTTPSGERKAWWLRSSYLSGSAVQYYVVDSNGNRVDKTYDTYQRICLGFCLGLEQES